MAAEAISLGASVVAFVGLAGQVISGCQFVSNLIDDTKDAHDDLSNLSQEVKIIQGSVFFFQNTPLLLEQSGAAKDILDMAEPVFKKIYHVIEQERNFIAGLSKNEGTWRDLKVAFRKQRIVKLLDRLQNAKANLQILQQNANLVLSERQSRLGPEIKQSLLTISSTLDASQTFASQTHGRTGEILQNLDHVRLNIDSSQPMLSNIQNGMEEMRLVTREIKSKATRLQSDLPTQIMRLESAIAAMRTELNTKLCTTSSIWMMESNEALYARPPGSLGHSNIYGLSLQNSRKKCVVNTYTIRTWIVNINIRSVTNSQEVETIHPFDNKLSKEASKINQINFDIQFLPGLFRRGIFFSIIQGQSPGQPAMDMKLRVYNIVRPDALIVEACYKGDLHLVQRLFEDGLATPFDQLPDGHTLLNVVLEGIWGRVWEFSVPDMHRHYKLFEYLVDLGLDPGISRTLYYVERDHAAALQVIVSLTRSSHNQFKPIFTNLARLIIEKSSENPFLDIRYKEIQRFEQIGLSQPSLLTKQSIWEVEEPPIDANTGRIFNTGCHAFVSALRDDPEAQSCRSWLSSMDSCTDEMTFLYHHLHFVSLNLKYNFFGKSPWLESAGFSVAECTLALYNWFALLIEFGLDIRISEDDLLYFLDETGRLDLLRTLMRKVSRGTRDIDDFLEDKDSEGCASLVYQLANLGAQHPAFSQDKSDDIGLRSFYAANAALSNFHRNYERQGTNYNYFKGELRYQHISEANWSDYLTKCSTKPRTPRILRIPFIWPSSRIRCSKHNMAFYEKHSWQPQ